MDEQKTLKTIKTFGREVVLDTSNLKLNLGHVPVTIVGEATPELPFMGRILIVYAPQLNCSDYPWDFAPVQECFLVK